MEVFSLENLISLPTCFKKDCVPSLVDVILTNSKSLTFKTMNLPNAVSNCHNIISTCLNCEVPSDTKQKFDEEVFCNNLKSIPIPSLENISEQDNINAINEM